MAGAGRRTFTPGEVLTASNVMNYLQDQAVMNFAGTAARGSAIGTAVSEGMVSYLADLNQVQVYDGSSWKQVYPSVANAGEVVQVVSQTYTTQTATSSSSFVSTGLTATITPTSSSNKVLVLVNQVIVMNGNGAYVSISRNSTNLGNGDAGFGYIYASTASLVAGASRSILDSPATTSATTYTATFRANTAGQTQTVQYTSSTSTITLMEIKA